MPARQLPPHVVIIALVFFIGCQSPVGTDVDCSQLSMVDGPTAHAEFSVANTPPEDTPAWHTAIDSLTSHVAAEEVRGSVAYYSGNSSEALATQLESIGFEPGYAFSTFSGLSFSGEVQLYPELKAIDLIYGLYIGNPANDGSPLDCV